VHRLLQDDDDNNEIGIDNMLSGNNHGWSYEILNGGWKWKRKWFLVVEGERVSNENQNGEVNKIWMHVCLFKLLDICIAILLWYSYSNNMYFIFRTIACTTVVDSSLG
jgi:hypothetical protein